MHGPVSVSSTSIVLISVPVCVPTELSSADGSEVPTKVGIFVSSSIIVGSLVRKDVSSAVETNVGSVPGPSVGSIIGSLVRSSGVGSSVEPDSSCIAIDSVGPDSSCIAIDSDGRPHQSSKSLVCVSSQSVVPIQSSCPLRTAVLW
jgi:hypothetical protein